MNFLNHKVLSFRKMSSFFMISYDLPDTHTVRAGRITSLNLLVLTTGTCKSKNI